MNYVLRRPLPPINFSRLSNADFYAITEAQLDNMTVAEIEAYQANINRRSKQTIGEINKHMNIVNAAKNALGRPLGPKRTAEDDEELDRLFAEEEARRK